MEPTLRVLGRMIIADTLVSLRSAPQPWSAANDSERPRRSKKPKNRDKVKAARKQRNRK